MNKQKSNPAETAADLADKAKEFVATGFEKVSSLLAAQPDAAKQGFEALSAASKQAQARLTEIQAKGVEAAEHNSKSAFAFVRDALAAKSPETFFSLQQDFFKAQQEVALRQVQEFNGLTMGLLREFMTPMQDSLTKSMAMFDTKKAA